MDFAVADADGPRQPRGSVDRWHRLRDRGGLGTLASALPTVEAYDVASDTWTSKAPMSTGRMAPAVGAIGGKLYVAGGHCCDDSGSDSLEIYDPGSDTWTAGAAPPTEREEVGFGVINGMLYVAGGLGSGRNLLTTLEIYDPVANAWSTRAPMPIAVDGQGSAVVGGKLFLFGDLRLRVPAPFKLVVRCSPTIP